MAAQTIDFPVGPNGARIRGRCDPQFLPVLAAFTQNFERSDELGACVAVTLDGKNVVDLWGGWFDVVGGRCWDEHNLTVVFSNTKPATALCAHVLVDEGLLDIDKPVAHYWPSFSKAGKEDITVRMLLDHTAGLPAIRQPLPDDAAFDWEQMVTRLEQEAPFWTPGSRVGYHGLTFGWLVGEVVRRVCGRSLGDFFHQRIATCLDLDFWIGLPEQEEGRVARITPAIASEQPRNSFERALLEEPDSVSSLYFRNTGGWRPSGFNSRRGHAAEIGAAGGITNARALARLYGALSLGGSIDGRRLISETALSKATQVSAATHLDVCLRVPTRFASGFMRQMDNRSRGLDSACFGADAFGHVGAGGSLAFASAKHRLGFAYVMNRMGSGVLMNERADRLVDAVYTAVEDRDFLHFPTPRSHADFLTHP